MNCLVVACLLVSSVALSHAAVQCEYGGKYYPVGSFKPSPCQPCHCGGDGQAHCAIVDCFNGCVDAVHHPDQCCPSCPNGQNCRAPDGTIIKKGDTYSPDVHTTCSCTFGTFAQCSRVH